MSQAEDSSMVRPFHPEDIASFHETLDIVARERKYLTMLAAPPIDELRHHLLREHAADAPQFVAEVAGRVVRWCDIGRHYFPSHAHRGSVGMGLLPGFRGVGLGKRLLEAAVQDAWAKGFLRIELGVRTDNERAIRLYRSLGFREEGVAARAVQVDGDFFDTLNMALLFG